MASKGNAQGMGGNSKVVPLGGAQPSSNAYLGIDDRVAEGTVGCRENMTIGGDEDSGNFVGGDSVARDSKEMNSGGGSKPSQASGQYGRGGFDTGSVASRENMTYGGGENTGNMVGEGVNSTGLSSFDRFFSGLPMEPGLDLTRGTADGEKNMMRAQKGIGGARVRLPKNKD